MNHPPAGRLPVGRPTPSTDADALTEAMAGGVLAETTLTGTYSP